MSGRSGIVLNTLVDYRRLSLGGGWIEGEGCIYVCEHPVSIIVGGDVLSKTFLSENFRRCPGATRGGRAAPTAAAMPA
jgi:hypothetical protein